MMRCMFKCTPVCDHLGIVYIKESASCGKKHRPYANDPDCKKSIDGILKAKSGKNPD